ncbi:MAG: hypothetical protein AABW64_01530 [Nanoarchaeota archaeon]
MNTIQLFKICYQWYEGDYHEAFLGKDATVEEFEKDLIKAKKFAQSLLGKEIEEGSYLGKGYSVACLPEYYHQIIWFLVEKKRYMECSSDKDVEYYVEDGSTENPIAVEKKVKKIEWQKIKDEEEKEAAEK